MNLSQISNIPWRKSSYSGESGDCVEIALLGGTPAVRDSKDPRGHVVSFAPDAWAAFVGELKGDGFPAF
ncbi:DUF397 domain-containing protein [Streptomyces sp. H27-D2]|uniref:DUF397 domain-containing protein n=1 Tax=Streptomyces sp. H27-D2 TaxID=3046304 RepID=UPI002DB7DE5B|nr:DUF397 domain-containing protein [Streptomyces sp. H27-D2]MEC4017126.1 DUF397 domain-containing protein [Streptomyces sp. H27-D2]